MRGPPPWPAFCEIPRFVRGRRPSAPRGASLKPTSRTTVGARIATGAACLSLLLGPVPHPAWAQPRLLLFLNGTEVSTPVVSAEQVGSEIFLPVAPIADRLQAALELTPDVRLVVSDPVLGRTTEYEQATGIVRRDGTILFGLAAGLVRGSQVADLQAPLPLVTILFDLEAQIPSAGDRVELASRVGVPEARLHSPADLHVRDLRYRGYANHFDGFTDGGLGIDATARVHRGILEASALGQGEEGQIAYLRSATLTYRDPVRSIWSAGDLRGVGEMGWLLAAGRGGRWSHRSKSSERRTSAGIYELLVGSKNVGRRINAPSFDGLTGLVEHAVTPPSRDGRGTHLALGGGWLGRTESMPAGVLTAADLLLRDQTYRLGARAGLFAGTDRGAGNGTGLELRGEWNPYRIWHLGGRFGNYDSDFRLPRPSFPEAGTRNVSFDTSVQPDPWLRLSLSHSQQHSIVAGKRMNRLENGTIGVTTPSLYLRNMYLSLSQYVDSTGRDTKSVSLNFDGGKGPIRWFAASRRQWDDTGGSWGHTIGATARTIAGDGQFSTAVADGRLDAVSLYWNSPLFAQRSLQVGLGDRWERIANLNGKHMYGQFRLTWRTRSGHGLEFAVEENQATTSVRLSVSGDFLFPDVGDAPVGGLGSFEPTRGIVFGQVYQDKNLNGRFDDEDRPLPDVVIRLDGGRHRRVTDDLGRYEFSAVEAGPHTLDIAGETVRADLTLLEDASHPVHLPAMSRMQIDFRVAANRAISGVIFADRNGNGTWDAGEEGLADVRLYVAGGRDAVSFYDGSFRLGDVPPGTRVLLVDSTSLPPQLELPASITLVVEAGRDPAALEIAVPVTGRPVTRKKFTGD